MKSKKRFICFILFIAILLALTIYLSFGTTKKASGGKISYDWKITDKRYKNFTDLGDYVIDCDPHRDFNFDKALAYANARYDKITKSGGCTALATKTKSGDVIIGRNMDLTVSQLPCYITHLHYGKYETINFTYDELAANSLTYKEQLEKGEIDEDYYNALPLLATDSMNSEGLYVELNMRDIEPDFTCFGTNPNADIRTCSMSLPFILASNCATVEEAVQYLRQKLDVYTIQDDSVASGWNLCLLIGDAKGNYGLVEFAKDEIYYLPFQHGHANYYITPTINATSREQCGYGRLQFGLERIDKVQNERDMAELMKSIMWKNEIMNIPYAYQDKDGHVHFYADEAHTIPSLDWRSDNTGLIPVNEAGQYVDVNGNTEEAKQVRQLKKSYDDYLAGIDKEKNLKAFNEYSEYLNRCNLSWVQVDKNFKDLQRGLIQYYTDSGIMDKLTRYYDGDEDPLRNDGSVWTTSLNFTVNCTKKQLTLRFWEKPNTVMHCQW